MAKRPDCPFPGCSGGCTHCAAWIGCHRIVMTVDADGEFAVTIFGPDGFSIEEIGGTLDRDHAGAPETGVKWKRRRVSKQDKQMLATAVQCLVGQLPRETKSDG